ncbi:MAG: thioredoxin family protein [Cyanobacteria bacterium SZAS-4]|nr:thioredoxin family protein [Cyanobacteria bacterium SZAS-4]
MLVVLQIVGLFAALVGLVFFDQWLYQQYHLSLYLSLWYRIATSLWAAWDARKLQITRYRTVFSLHPVAIFLFCALLWIIFTPLYLVARRKVVKGTATLKSEAELKPKSASYFAKLLGFAAACLCLGGVALFCMFAPRINPGFLNDSIFQDSSQADALMGRRISREDRSFFRPIIAHLNAQFPDRVFDKMGITVPENVEFKTSDGVTLKGWYFTTPAATKTVLFSGDGLFGMRFPVMLGYIKLLQQANYSVLIYDYRKFSQSGTKSDTENSLTDLRAAFEYLQKDKKLKPAEIILMGRGIGATLCCELNQTAQCAGLVLEDPFTNLKDHVDQSSAWAMKVIPRSMYPKNGMDITEILKSPHAPVLISASSPRDSGGYDVFEQTVAPKQFVKLRIFNTAGFPDLRICADKYSEKLRTFLDAAQAPPEKSMESRISDLEKRLNAPEEMKWQTDIEKGSTSAKAEKKMMLIDVYTTWCGPCKRMDAQTYSDPGVQSFIKQHFIAVKVDAEDDQGREFCKTNNVHSYPTLLIFDADGTTIDRFSGYVSGKELLRELNGVLGTL